MPTDVLKLLCKIYGVNNLFMVQTQLLHFGNLTNILDDDYKTKLFNGL